MFNFSLFAIKPIVALTSYATTVAYALILLLDALTNWTELGKALATGAFTVLAALAVLMLRERYSKREKGEARSDATLLQLSEAGEAVAKLSAAERADYLARLEGFFKMEREFYAEREKQQQAIIALQRETNEASKSESERLRFLLREAAVDADLVKSKGTIVS